MRQKLQNQRGSVTILVAVAMILFLSMLATVVDLGLLFLEKNRLSNAVDAAALAGVQELPINPGDAFQQARRYLDQNFPDLTSSRVVISNENKEIRVLGQKQVDFFIAPIIGIDSWEIEASAAAKTDVVTAIRGVVPLGVVKREFVFGEQYLLKYGSGSGGSHYKGNFGALALGSSGASRYRKNLAEGFDGIIRIGDWVPTEPGNMAGPTVQAVRARIGADNTFSTWDNIAKGCTRLMIVPVIESLEVNGRKPVKVVGFAAFFLESTSRRGKDDFIVGRFIRYAAQGEIGDGEDFGLKAARLIE